MPVVKKRHEKLSEREQYVLNGIVEGKRFKEMAAELELDLRTVSTYHMRLLRKMGMQSDADLIRYALRHKLIERD